VWDSRAVIFETIPDRVSSLRVTGETRFPE
jgi:hypothetical protein